MAILIFICDFVCWLWSPGSSGPIIITLIATGDDQLCSSPPSLLLGIQFHDQLLLDVLRNALTLRVCKVCALHVFFTPLHPVDTRVLAADHAGNGYIGFALGLQLYN